ncbi:alpha/beta hydrolase [Rhizobium sp. TRM95111]|uniref:alpha/beta fold hydrolase n=1 Tax=Rhizobium alarense TaxID=2846851 RepID=UPI001F199D0D|nr:alpha/beta hydrolase [Rhizobium alarense]MCF3638430.1 alpha/beta hydrolase [Rhizobium alarense]
MLAVMIGPVLAGFAGYAYTAHKVREIERAYPNIGERIDVGGYALNSVHVQRSSGADLPPIVFIHGASGNLRDQMAAFRVPLEGRAEMLFVDRPGHGYSDRGGVENDYPDGQAEAIARLMEKRGIARAIIVGHSFGGAIAASFALYHPEKTLGLMLLAPATHPWPGGVDWYYRVASNRYAGWLFNHLVALPAGLSRLDAGTRFVFAPNARPQTYVAETGPALVLRPETFRSNATDVANLQAYVRQTQPYYREIEAPTVIITGDSDGVVLEEIHSRGLARDIKGSELLWIRNLGHKPDHVVTDVAVAAIEKIAGKDRDLQDLARRAEARLAGDAAR